MKAFLIQVMTAMMPMMKPLVWLALAAFVLGLALSLAKVEGGRSFARVAFRVLVAIGVFFVAAQVMGMWLGAEPKINFGDSSKFEFILVPFWQLGIAMLAGAGVLKFIQRRRFA